MILFFGDSVVDLNFFKNEKSGGGGLLTFIKIKLSTFKVHKPQFLSQLN